MIRVDLRTRRVWIFNRRIHHFWLGVILIASDWRDWRVWVADLWKGDR